MPRKSVVRLTGRLDMTIVLTGTLNNKTRLTGCLDMTIVVDWDFKQQN